MATLLYIDTSGNTATVAVSQNGVQLALRLHEQANEQAAVLNTMIETALADAGLSLREIDAVCVCAGPGSYTGLHVGIGVAKGICYALDKPVMLFNKLDLLALSFSAHHRFAIALKARAGEYFFALYDIEDGKTMSPRHLLLEEIDTLLQQEADLYVITDDDSWPPAANLSRLTPNAPASIPEWIPVAEKRQQAGAFDDLAYCEPFYLKAAYTTQSKK